MGIRVKALGLAAVAMLLLWGGLWHVSAAYSAKRAAELDSASTMKSLDRTELAIDYMVGQLAKTANDWAEWDDTYEFVQDLNPDYEESNLQDETLATLQLDFMIYTNGAGEIVYAKTAGTSDHSAAVLPAGITDYVMRDARQAGSAISTSPVSGLLTAGDAVYVLAAHPISTSDGSAKPNGTYVIGHRVGEEESARLRELTGLDVAILPANTSALPQTVASSDASKLLAGPWQYVQLTDQSALGYSSLAGLDGQPGAVVRVKDPRTALVTGRLQTTRESGLLILFALVLLLTFALLIDATILRRLERLSSGLHKLMRSGKEAARLEMSGRDEITRLAEDVNALLDEIGRSHAEVTYLAAHDSLTGLYNRRYFDEALARQLAEQQRIGGEGAVICFDLDDFKDVNDSLGHAAGDELLAGVAACMREQVRDYSVVARLGGDEFAMLVPHVSRDDMKSLGVRLMKALTTRSFPCGSHQVRVSISAGTALYPEHGTTVADLLSRADLAMYDAKERRSGELVFYTADDTWRSEMTQRIEQSERIVAALQDDTFSLHAQPVYSLADRSPVSFELLLRATNESGEIFLPHHFMPAAERLGLTRDIDRWVIRRAVQTLTEHSRHDRTEFSVNVSSTALHDRELLETLRAELEREQVDARLLTIEMREQDLSADIDAARAFIAALGDIGCGFRIDAFGSGAWSFSCLRHLSAGSVKIDGSVVRGSGSHPEETYLLQAIVSMCRELGIAVIVSQVQDAETLRKARENGIEFAQGGYLGEPAPLGADGGATGGADADSRADAAREARESGFRLGFSEGA